MIHQKLSLTLNCCFCSPLRRPQALPGEFLAVENTSADSMFFLVKGKVKLTCGGSEICMYGAWERCSPLRIVA